MSWSWSAVAVRLFGIDLRTIALFRFLLASVMIFNVVGRMFDVELMYGADGAMPQGIVRNIYFAGEWVWSLYYLSSSLWFQWLLLSTTLVVAVLLGLGWKTRVQTVLAWLLIASLHHRAPLLVTGGDMLLSMLIFWSIFLPLGAVWSLDSRGRRRTEQRIVSVASGMIMLQMAIMYFFTGISKCNDIWYNGEALANIYQYGLVTRPLGNWFLQFPVLLKLVTWWTLVLELVGPFLMFSPWLTARMRRWTVAAFFLLHVGIEATMRVVIFSFVSMTGLSLFISPRFWEGPIGRRIAALLDRLFRHQPAAATASSPNAAVIRSRHLVNGAVLLLAMSIFAINVPFLWRGSSFVHQLGPIGRRMGGVLACVQRWDMFATPAFGDFRFVAIGIQPDGSQIDLLREGAPVQLDDPSRLPVTIRTARWLGMYYDLMRPDRYLFRREFARYLLEQWNADHRGESAVNSVQLVLLVKSPRPVEPDTKPAMRVLDVYDPLVDGQYVNGLKEGEFVVRHENGKLASRGRYRRGEPVGMWEYWNEQGELEGRGSYEQGQMEGKWELFYDGERQEVWFHEGRPVPPPAD